MIFSLNLSLPILILLLFLVILFLGIYVSTPSTSPSYYEFEDEGFQNLQPSQMSKSKKDKGDPFSRLLDSYPSNNRTTVTDNSSRDVWFYYPSFAVNSFKQLTNNLKYFKNPDIGSCTPTEFCGSFYKDKPKKDQQSNVVHELPPVPVEQGIRINYYRTPYNLFLSDQPGIQCPLPAF